MPTPVEPPSWTGAAHARNIASAAMRVTYQLRAHGAHHVGTSGPLLMVCRSENIMAGSLIHATVPRPVHVMANEAMSTALRQGMMAKAGVIPVTTETAIEAQRAALAALEDERAVVVMGSLLPVGYLVAMTGVDVLPVVMLGSEARVHTDPPRPRTRIDVYYAPAVPVAVPGDPLRATTRAAIEEQVRQIVIDAEQQAAMRAGRE